MKDSVTSEQKRGFIVELRQRGESYSAIGRDRRVNLDRRTVKKLYEEWEKEQCADETQETRLQLKLQLMADHVTELVSFSRALARALAIRVADDELSGEEVVRRFLQCYSRDRDIQLTTDLAVDEKRLLERRNERLLRDLRTHTASTSVWQLVQDYMSSRDSWADGRVELEQQVEAILKYSLAAQEDAGHVPAGKPSIIRRLARNISSVYISAIVRSVDTDPLPQSFSQLEPAETEAVRASYKCRLANERIHVEFKAIDRVVAMEGADHPMHGALCDALKNATSTLLDGSEAGALATKLGRPLVAMMQCHDELLAGFYEPSFKGLILDSRCDHCPM